MLIIVRVYDNYVKQELLSSYFKRKNLNLKDIGFKTSARIFINESLTKSNRDVFNLASAAKKANHIVKLFTRNGMVHVQRQDNAKPIRIEHISDLEQILPLRFGCTSSMTASRRWTHNQQNPSIVQSSTHFSVTNHTSNDAMATTKSNSSETPTIHPVHSLVPPNLS